MHVTLDSPNWFKMLWVAQEDWFTCSYLGIVMQRYACRKIWESRTYILVGAAKFLVLIEESWLWSHIVKQKCRKIPMCRQKADKMSQKMTTICLYLNFRFRFRRYLYIYIYISYQSRPRPFTGNPQCAIRNPPGSKPCSVDPNLPMSPVVWPLCMCKLILYVYN